MIKKLCFQICEHGLDDHIESLRLRARHVTARRSCDQKSRKFQDWLRWVINRRITGIFGFGRVFQEREEVEDGVLKETNVRVICPINVNILDEGDETSGCL